MGRLTVLFPIVTVQLLLLLFLDYSRLLAGPVSLGAAADRLWHRRDSYLALGLSLVYAVVAFLGLGDTRAVQSFCKFSARGEYAVVEFREPRTLGKLRYYSGLHMGNYYLQLSADGEEYYDAGKLEQGHADVFKWNELALDEEYRGAPVRALRLIADSELWLGELAIYDGNGRRISTGDFTWPGGCDPLFDEPLLIPERYDYANSTYFDEIYHARTAYEHVQGVYPYEITHPPLGKLILSLGIRAFGMTPFGWRFSGTLIGVLMLPAIYLFLKRMFGGTAVPACGTAVLAADFMHFTQTRIATIDSYAVFFIILMYLLFWRYLNALRDAGAPRRGWLPPLLGSGLCFGLGAASKWVCFYAGGGLAVLWLLDRIVRASAQLRDGRRAACLREAAENIAWCLLGFVAIPAAVYYLSYLPYGAARGIASGGPEMLLRREYLDLVLDNQKYMFNYHSGVTATHPYSSVWWQWMLDIRPILYYLQYPAEGVHVSFGAWVNPLLCWGGLGAMLCMAWHAIRWRDRTAAFILIGYLAQLLPWTLVTRVVFEYHYFPSTVFLLLALCHIFRSMELHHPRWRLALGGFTALSAGLFLLFYPALRGLPVTQSFGSNFLKWMPTWPY